jgi:amino acid permease
MMSPGGVHRHRKTFFKRTFSKLEKGSVRGSILSLCSAAVGGGVLSLPFVFVLSGWAVAIVLIIVGALAGVWSNLMIAEIAI